jgi:hypothetical protein
MKVTKWSTYSGESAVSEQIEQTSGEAGSTGAEPIVANSSVSEPTAAAEPAPVSAEAPSLVPEQVTAPEAHEVSAPQVEAPSEAAKEAPEEALKADAPRQPGKLLIMSAAGHGWDHDDAGPEARSEPNQSLFGKRRLAALAAVVALAALAGAVGGAMATVGLQHFASNDVVAAADTAGPSFGASVARIDADVGALKAGIEHASKMGMSQFNKTSDRLDKLEKAQAESVAKLARLSDGVEKVHVTPPATPVAAAAPQATKDVTGSITPPATSAAAAPKPEAKPEIARLPIIDAWVLQDVNRGGAWIEGRQGIYEVYAGDVVPGLGRIDAIRRQDGRWVVVTSRGLIVAR